MILRKKEKDLEIMLGNHDGQQMLEVYSKHQRTKTNKSISIKNGGVVLRNSQIKKVVINFYLIM